MIDSGADRDVISTSVIRSLLIPTKTVQMTVITVGSHVVEDRFIASFTMQSVDEEYIVDINDALVGDLLTSERDIPPFLRDLSDQPHIKGTKFPEAEGGVMMIIGAAHADAAVAQEIRRGPSGSLTCFRCLFGWTVCGKTGKRGRDIASINAIATDDRVLNDNIDRILDNRVLNSNIDRIFYHDFASSIVSQEEMGDSLENVRACKMLEEKTYFCPMVKKYFAPVTWKFHHDKIMEILRRVKSRPTAMKRLANQRFRFKRDPAFKERVFREIEKFYETGVAIEINSVDDDDSIEKPRWYLPLHVVELRGKTRVCHDARAATDGISLNDLLVGGPNLMNSLMDILMRFRQWKIAFMCDIKAFFHQIRVHPDDADLFRFFWFKDRTLREAILNLFLSHVFGSQSSSFVTSFTVRKHAEVIRPKYPYNVYDLIRFGFYVDDGSGGGDSVDEALQLKVDSVAAMAEGGMDLVKWKSNARQLMDGDPNVPIPFSDKQDDAPTKVLGVSWLPAEDVFIFICDEEFKTLRAKTPRQLVSMQAKLYDPLGFWSPSAYIGRRHLQLCRPQEVGWDSPLEESVEESFFRYTSSWPLLQQYRVERWWNGGVDNSNIAEVTIEIFCDAAPKGGYGAVAYRRQVNRDGDVHISFIASKSHVIPLNPKRASHHNSVPRVEIVSAEKAVQLKRFVGKTIKLDNLVVRFWSDSESALKMIYNPAKPRPVFFANRLSKIHSGSDPQQWRWVDSSNNPADHCSRGIQAHEAEKWRQFHHGPAFLRLPEDQWPKTNIATCPISAQVAALYVAESEKKQVADAILLAAASRGKWMHKLRIIGMVLIAVKRWRAYPRAKTRAAKDLLPKPEVTQDVLEEARKQLVKSMQRHHYSDVFEQLELGKVFKPESRHDFIIKNKEMRKLNPFVDVDGIIRVGSRLENADIAHDAKFPFILPPKDENVKSLIRHYHHNDFHAGAKHTLCQLRQFVWITKGLQAVKSVVNTCFRCQKNFKKNANQQMANLPSNRVNPAPVFAETGLDVMGHFLVKMNGRADHKVWIAVFTCFVSRAVHVELLFNMSADAMVNAIIRFAARRPGIRRFTSDCGTNLVGANNILKKELEAWNRSSTSELQRRGLRWDFITPRTPHYGGVWERIVALFKRHLASISTGAILHVDAFNTAVVEVEGILNRRPLTALSDDPNDSEALTPNHILNPSTSGHAPLDLAQQGVNSDADSAKIQWRRAQSRVDAFWKSWRVEYLSLLHARSKWSRSEKDFAVDDMVIVMDETLPRHNWSLGRVMGVEGSSAHVRRAHIRRQDGKIVTKDRTKLVRLELDS